MKLKKLILTSIIGTLAFLLYSNFTLEAKQPPKQETVILLHGLARSDRAMVKMARALSQSGYHVINHDYPSTTADIDTLTTQIFEDLAPSIHSASTVHFVTHSMGGIILQRHLQMNQVARRRPTNRPSKIENQQCAIPNLGRVVMLAPPSQGSEVPEKLGALKPFQWINGPAGNQLGTGTNSLPLRLAAPTYPLGIIAGDRSINPMLSLLIPGPDDGKVALARVKPAAYTDYLQLHVTHPCMVWNPNVIRQTLHFLEHEQFSTPRTKS